MPNKLKAMAAAFAETERMKELAELLRRGNMVDQDASDQRFASGGAVPKRPLTPEERQRPGGHVTMDELARAHSAKVNRALAAAAQTDLYGLDKPEDGSIPMPGALMQLAMLLAQAADLPAKNYRAANLPKDIAPERVMEYVTGAEPFGTAAEAYYGPRYQRHKDATYARLGATPEEEQSFPERLGSAMGSTAAMLPMPESAVAKLGGKLPAFASSTFLPMLEPSLGAYGTMAAINAAGRAK